jgi:excisionase family DNA binding protein
LLHTNVTYSERTRTGVPLLSVRQVAARLGVCTATVYALCARGALPHVRVLNAIRIEVGDLEAFVEG